MRYSKVVLAAFLALLVAALVLMLRRSESNSDSAGITAADATARDTVVISEAEPSCAICKLTYCKILTLGSTADAEIPRHVPQVFRDSRGFYYAAVQGLTKSPILRYDSLGRYLGMLGRNGQGPGEYRMMFSMAVGNDDRVYVADRTTVVFNPDSSYSHDIPPTRGLFIGPIPGTAGDFYAEIISHDAPAERGTTIRVYAPDGTEKRSFRVFSARELGGNPHAIAPDGSLWSLQPAGGIRLEQHSPMGEPGRVIGLKTPAFPNKPYMTYAEADSAAEVIRARPYKVATDADMRDLARRPRTEVSGLKVGADGLLWIATKIPAPGWQSVKVDAQYLSPDEAPKEITIPDDQRDKIHNTVIEVVDPVRGQLLARAQLPYLARLVEAGFASHAVLDEQGFIRMEIIQLDLQRPR